MAKHRISSPQSQNNKQCRKEAEGLWFLLPKISVKFEWRTPNRGAKYMWCGLKFATANPYVVMSLKWCKIRSYYQRLTGAPMHSIKWCYFQWPWVTH